MEFQHVNNLTDSQHCPRLQCGWTLPVHPLSALSLIVTIASLFIHRRYMRSEAQPAPGHHSAGNSHGTIISIDKTQIVLSKISHHRIFPVPHGFTYSYLSVGIPVRSPQSNWLLSIDDEAHHWWNRGWLRVRAKHHLHRGRDGLALSANLDGYLREEVSSYEAHFMHGHKDTMHGCLNLKQIRR